MLLARKAQAAFWAGPGPLRWRCHISRMRQLSQLRVTNFSTGSPNDRCNKTWSSNEECVRLSARMQKRHCWLIKVLFFLRVRRTRMKCVSAGLSNRIKIFVGTDLQHLQRRQGCKACFQFLHRKTGLCCKISSAQIPVGSSPLF